MLLLAFGTLSACGAPAGPDLAVTSEEIGAVREGTAAAIVLRFVGKDPHGAPVKPFVSDVPLLPSIVIGDFETGGAPTKKILEGLKNPHVLDPRGIPGRFLSEDSRTAGWMVLFLPAGYYYLDLLGDTATGSSSETGVLDIPGAAQWRVEVPPGVPVVYAGTLESTVRTIHHTIWGAESAWFGQITGIEDDSSPASQFARRELPGLPPPITRLAVRHSGPHLIGLPIAVLN